MKTLSLITATAALAALPIAGADAQSTSTRQYEGTVVSVNRDAKTFRLRDAERGTVRIRVTSRTRFERVSGLRGLRAGQTNIEAVVRRSNGSWVATSVERSGGGGSHGGGGGDDRGGDDHGGRGRGSDD
jgi:hypothetical protein